jgi:enoyl-CoA hydratase/carnithine racemase
MADTLLELVIAQGIATLTLNRPDKRNAFSDAMRREFIEALESVTADPSIRALVLTGAGKAFCAGGDIAGMKQRLSAPSGELAFNGWRRQQIVHRAQALLHTCPKPVIAAVNGAASGLGADTALACDFIMGSEHASFTWSYILRGIMPDGGGMYFLPRRIGLSQAKQLIFTGRRVDADEALALGILDRKVSGDQLLDAAQDWARELSQVSMTALGLTKTIINQSFELGSHEVFAQGSQAQGICYTSSEHRAAVEAFLAKVNS